VKTDDMNWGKNRTGRGCKLKPGTDNKKNNREG